jgi:hypothetical protein
LFASLFSNGMGWSVVATGALPVLKYRYATRATRMKPNAIPAKKVLTQNAPVPNPMGF